MWSSKGSLGATLCLVVGLFAMPIGGVAQAGAGEVAVVGCECQLISDVYYAACDVVDCLKKNQMYKGRLVQGAYRVKSCAGYLKEHYCNGNSVPTLTRNGDSASKKRQPVDERAKCERVLRYAYKMLSKEMPKCRENTELYSCVYTLRECLAKNQRGVCVAD